MEFHQPTKVHSTVAKARVEAAIGFVPQQGDVPLRLAGDGDFSVALNRHISTNVVGADIGFDNAIDAKRWIKREQASILERLQRERPSC